MNLLQKNQLSSQIYSEFYSNESIIDDLNIDRDVLRLYQTFKKLEISVLDSVKLLEAIRAFGPKEKTLMFDINDNLVDRARKFAIHSHRKRNQLYSEDNTLNISPYEFHLWKAVQFAKKYLHYIPIEFQDIVIAATWNHDIVEDAGITYNDLKKVTNSYVADIATAVTTNLYGKNRKERADDNYYARINTVKYATYVKLCDRLANVSMNGSMLDKYRKEMPEFLAAMPESQNYPELVAELKYAVGL